MKLRVTLFIALVAALGTSAFATSITVGGTNQLNVFPFGCGPTCAFPYSGEYQQVYSSSVFSGPFTITQIAFETRAGISGSLSDTFTLGLGTTLATAAAPGTSYAGNRRPDFTSVFSGTVVVPSTGAGTFDFIINLSTPFTYNPSNGNLLLDVNIASDTTSGNGISFVAGTNTVDVGRLFNIGGNGAATPQGNFGLLTQFSGEASQVPEPTSLTLVATGLTFGARRWRNRRQQG
jgi:hypothetical protein